MNELEMTCQGNVLLQAASYDFELPLKVNGARWPTASPSPPSTPSCCSTSAGSKKRVVKLHSHSVAMATWCPRRVQATGAVGNMELRVCVLVSDMIMTTICVCVCVLACAGLYIYIYIIA